MQWVLDEYWQVLGIVYYQLNMSDMKLVGKKSCHFMSLAGSLLFHVVCQDVLVIISSSHLILHSNK